MSSNYLPVSGNAGQTYECLCTCIYHPKRSAVSHRHCPSFTPVEGQSFLGRFLKCPALYKSNTVDNVIIIPPAFVNF